MNKMIVTIVIIVGLIIMINDISCSDVHADADESPVYLTKEADEDVDFKQDEATVPDTGDGVPAGALTLAVIIAGTTGAITVRATVASHKNP